MKEDGHVLDVIPGGVAAKAGLAPAMRVMAVNGRKLGKETLLDALKLGRPIELLVLNAEYYKTLKLDYRGGDKQPHIARDGNKPDLLPAIMRPLQTSASPAK
jgi:predicted metalloprotease with PDZ domain